MNKRKKDAPSGRIEFVIAPDREQRLQAYCQQKGVTVTKVISRLIAEELKAADW